MSKMGSNKAQGTKLRHQEGITIEPWWAIPPGKSVQETHETKRLSTTQTAETAEIPHPVFLGILSGVVSITQDFAAGLEKLTKAPK